MLNDDLTARDWHQRMVQALENDTAAARALRAIEEARPRFDLPDDAGIVRVDDHGRPEFIVHGYGVPSGSSGRVTITARLSGEEAVRLARWLLRTFDTTWHFA